MSGERVRDLCHACGTGQPYEPPGLLLSAAQAERDIFKSIIDATECVYEWSKPYGHAMLSGPNWSRPVPAKNTTNGLGYPGRWRLTLYYWDASEWPKKRDHKIECEGETVGLLFLDAYDKLSKVEHSYGKLDSASAAGGGKP